MSDYWSVGVSVVLNQLKTNPHHGLTGVEARLRLNRFGPNVLPPPKPRSTAAIVWHQLTSPIVLIMIVAAGVTLAQHHLPDATVIIIVIIANTLIGFWQERSAEKIISRLHHIITPMARVIRDGAVQKLPARLLVPGDIIKVESGDLVPADCRLLTAQALTVNQASLTGESVPDHKRETIVAAATSVQDRANVIFSSTLIVNGQAMAVVVATGLQTEIGRIAESVKSAASTRPSLLEGQLRGLTGWLTIAALGLVSITFIIGAAQGVSLLTMFETALALLVSIIPEGLLIALTVSLSVGLNRLYRHRVLIRRLAAVETFGSVTVLALDKTGTLTEGTMMVEKIILPSGDYQVSGDGFSLTGSFYRAGQPVDLAHQTELKNLLELTCLTTMSTVAKADLVKDRARQLTDPTETALAVVAAKGGYYAFDSERAHPELLELPFDQDRRFSASIHRFGSHNRVIAKGALESIIDRSSFVLDTKQKKLVAEAKQDWRSRAETLAAAGYRVVALAYADYPLQTKLDATLINNLTLVGLLALDDPVRLEAKETINRVQAGGVRTLMITGDHQLTAENVAAKLGLNQHGQVIHAQDLATADLKNVAVVARATPQDKLVIVERLQKAGEVVAMTGDGVNDAPALARANVGIAIGQTGTDIAVLSSDVVLQDSQIDHLWQAITEGRLIEANIRKIVYYLVSTSLGEVLIVIWSLLANLPLPLLAAQILWLNLVTDGVTSMALATETNNEAETRQPQPKLVGSLLSPETLIRMAIVSVVMAIGAIVIYRHFDSITYARTAALTTLVFFQLFNLFNSRSATRSVFQTKLTTNPVLLGLFGLAALLQLLALYWPPLTNLLGLTALDGPTLVLCLVIASSVIWIDELFKLARLGIINWAKTQVELKP